MRSEHSPVIRRHQHRRRAGFLFPSLLSRDSGPKFSGDVPSIVVGRNASKFLTRVPSEMNCSKIRIMAFFAARPPTKLGRRLEEQLRSRLLAIAYQHTTRLPAYDSTPSVQPHGSKGHGAVPVRRAKQVPSAIIYGLLHDRKPQQAWCLNCSRLHPDRTRERDDPP